MADEKGDNIHFIRNSLIPAVTTLAGAFAGFLVVGLPGIEMAQTLDGSPVPGGIPPEQVSTIIAEGRKIGSYIDFYGVSLPGEPLYRSVGVIAVLALVGYWIGAIAKVKNKGGRKAV